MARGRPTHVIREVVLRRAALMVLVLAGSAGAAVPEARAARMVPGAIELEDARNVPAQPGDVIDAEEDGDGAREFVVAPLPSRNPLLGWTLTLPAFWLYRPSFAQPGDKVWTTGAAAFYAESESLGGGLFHKMSLGGDQWRVTAAAFTADLRYDYFGIGGDPDFAIPLRQDVDLGLAEALYRVRANLYLGLQVIVSGTEVGLDLPPDLLPPGVTPPQLGVEIGLVSLKPRLVYDSRDDEFYPRDGWLTEGGVAVSRDGFGSDVDYERHEWALNRYQAMTDRGTLALRGAMQYVGGDAPFFVFPAFGSGSDLRGYQTGTYRDRFLLAAQAEWRQTFGERWGAVAFAGIGTVAPEFAEWGRSLPSAGVGLRWVVAPKNGLRLRLDVAWGRGDSEFYLSIGEAF